MSAALIGLDWGTTSCRAYLIGADGAVLERVADGPGILKVENGAFGAALDAMIGRWDAQAAGRSVRHDRQPAGLAARRPMRAVRRARTTS